MTLPAGAFRRGWFVDSSAFFAHFTRGDANHEPASLLFTRAGATAVPLVTTNFIIAEAHALFLSRTGRGAGVQFLRWSEANLTNVIRAAAEDEAAAREIIYRFTDKEFSLVDAISFAVMERLRLGVAFTFDSDFERYGFERVRA